MAQNRYEQIIERIFLSRYQEGMRELEFLRQDIIDVAQELGIVLPKNVGDVIYSFRYRTDLPDSIESKAPEGYTWMIRPKGRSRYCFVAVTEQAIIPSQMLSETNARSQRHNNPAYIRPPKILCWAFQALYGG